MWYIRGIIMTAIHILWLSVMGPVSRTKEPQLPLMSTELTAVLNSKYAQKILT